MKSRISAGIVKGQGGFTLLEVIATLAITGIIGLGSMTATVQVLHQGSRNGNHNTADRHTMNALYWISRDAQMSQNVTPEGDFGFPLTLSWIEWDNSEHQITYALTDDILQRSYSIDGGVASETVIARYLNSVSGNSTCDYSGGVLTVKVTATVGDGTRALNVTKEREITPRPGL